MTGLLQLGAEPHPLPGPELTERMWGEKMFACFAVTNRLVGNSKSVTVLARFLGSLWVDRERDDETGPTSQGCFRRLARVTGNQKTLG